MYYYQRPQGLVMGFIIRESLTALAEVNHDGVFKAVQPNHAVNQVFSQFVHFSISFSLFLDTV